jgi:hypothetical protein
MPGAAAAALTEAPSIKVCAKSDEAVKIPESLAYFAAPKEVPRLRHAN